MTCGAIWRDPADVVLECAHVLWASALYCVILKKRSASAGIQEGGECHFKC